jgi:hypothetical protein
MIDSRALVAALSLLLSLAAAAPRAHAQAVYRCGSTYSQTPCPDGRIVPATDPRSAAQRAEAKRVAALERQQGQQMERERLAQEAAQKPATAAGFDSRASASAGTAVASDAGRHHAKKKRRGAKHVEGEDFVAVDPSSLKKSGRK